MDLAGRIGKKPAGVFGFEASEAGKTLDAVLGIDRWLMEQGADRDAFILGIGGGITTDITGFAASVYKRGVRFAFLPTTLLSQVDAAIGGKNGVNLDSFKNMIGVFRQPEATFICPEPLATLPYSQIISGAAELLKTFIICNKDGCYEKAVSLLTAMKSSPGDWFEDYSASLGNLVAEAAGIKAGIAGRDPQEHGERRLLNLGHTFAHAIEAMSKGAVGHGEAVSIGIILATRLSERLKLAPDGLASRLESDFKACGLNTVCPFRPDDLVAAMARDKKAEGGTVHFVLPLEIGRVETRSISPHEAARLLEQS